MAMDLVFDTLDGHSMEFGTEGCKLMRTGTAANIPAAVKSDPLMLLRAFEGVVRKVSPRYPKVIGSYITKINLRPAKGTNQAQFAIEYSGPPQLPKPQSRWVIEDSSTLAGEQTELDLNGDVLMVKWTPPGKQAPPPDGVGVGGLPLHFSGGGQPFKPVYHSASLNVLRPRRQISITGWIIGRPGQQALDAQDCVNDTPMFGLKRGYWLCSHVFAKNENAAKTPFPDATMLYHVGATFMTKVKRDWMSYIVFKDKFGQVPPSLSDPPEVRRRKAVLAGEYTTDQIRINGFTLVGMYEPIDLIAAFGL